MKKTEKQDKKDKKPYKRPTLEKHNQLNRFAFGGVSSSKES